VGIGAGNALLLIDVQRGFEDPMFGPRDRPEAEANIARLIDAWRLRGAPVVFVRHDWPDSPLAAGTSRFEFKDVVSGEPDLLITKSVHSAFHGDRDLDAWLRGRDIDALTIRGTQTNVCCETTARLACDLGYEVEFVIDATHTFDADGPDGVTVTASELARASAASLHEEFAQVLSTDAVIVS
jgi:nicotinamidase-related amidase